MPWTRALALAVMFVALVDPACRAQEAPSQRLRALADEYWRHLEATSIEIRSLRGLPIEKFPDVSLEAARREAAMGTRWLQALAAIDRQALDEQDVDTAGALRFAATELVESLPHYWLFPRLTPYASPLTSVRRVCGLFAFQQRTDAERYLVLLADLPRFLDDLGAVVEGQAARGIRMPRAALVRALPPIEALRRPAADSPWRPAAARLAALESSGRAEFLSAVDRQIEGAINPAFDRLIAALRAGERAAPEGVGLGQYPGGPEAYRFLVRSHTTLGLGPEEIHRVGLTQLERIGRDIDALRPAFSFPGSAAEFRLFLKTDPRFFAARPEQLGERMIAAHQRILPLVDRYFVASARRPSGVERLDPALEGSMTFGYYDPPRPERPRGVYYYNGSRPGERSLLPMATLVYHELVPGHHFQVEAQRGSTFLPTFRQEGWITAYGEGWANYASDLAAEMGLYGDPWDKAGYLLNDAFLTSRLVVDTGMNALGWSRDRAMEFLRQNTSLAEEEIATETLRYATDIPGQALGYKMGALRFRELRDRAQAELGSRFDIRRFHDAVLSAGSLPFPVLEARVARWVAAEKARPAG